MNCFNLKAPVRPPVLFGCTMDTNRAQESTESVTAASHVLVTLMPLLPSKARLILLSVANFVIINDATAITTKCMSMLQMFVTLIR